MSLSENAESMSGHRGMMRRADRAGNGARANTSERHQNHVGRVPAEPEAMMSAMRTRPAEKPPDALLAALSPRPIELGRVFIVFRMRALCVMSATIKNL